MEKFWYRDKFIYCEFIITFLCNYTCRYCFFAGRQKRNAYMFRNRGPAIAHNRFNKIVFPALKRLNIFKYPDAFMNFPLNIWQDLFSGIFKGKFAYLSFTGGEPLIHASKITELIKTIADVSNDFIIRFDTNGSLIPQFPDELKKHIAYVVSYHPTHVKFDEFLSNLDKISNQGNIYMINRVVHQEELADALKEMDLFQSYGYYMNISPAFFDVLTWKKENQELLKCVTYPLDYQLRIERKTVGEKCKWPIFGFRLLPTGYADVYPCHKKIINLLKTKNLNNFLSKEEILCPSTNCTCLHAYSFHNCTERNAYSYDILHNFVKENINHRKLNIPIFNTGQYLVTKFQKDI